jgi:Mannosyltransferase putative
LFENGNHIWDVIGMAGSLRQAVSERLRSPPRYPEGRFEGRGIVICAGGPRYFVCAWVLIALLRDFRRVGLPIQVWHLGQGEMSEEMRLLLEALDVEVVDAETVVASFPARIAGGWPLKPYAIMQSRFREVLYLDADTVPLVDVSRIFSWDLYRKHGMVMWPDIVDLTAVNPIWGALGLEPRSHTSVEAGIVVVNKQRVWDVLDLAVLLNEHVEEVYSAVYGDKDTFLLSLLLKGRDLAIIPHRPFGFDLDLVQRDPDGEPILQHRNGSKWNLTGSNRPLLSAEVMRHCEQALADLRQRWSGAVFNPPPRTQLALAEVKRLSAVRNFIYVPQGSDPRPLELLPAGRLGQGKGVFEQHWAVVERGGALILQFYSATRLTIELTLGADGSWQGRCMMPVGFHAQLIEQTAKQTWPFFDSRVTKSAVEWVNVLIDPTLFAAGFNPGRARELRAALSFLNERFDDVPEQIGARLTTTSMPKRWRRTLEDAAAALALSRNDRLTLTRRSDYPRIFDPKHYDRIP